MARSSPPQCAGFRSSLSICAPNGFAGRKPDIFRKNCWGKLCLLSMRTMGAPKWLLWLLIIWENCGWQSYGCASAHSSTWNTCIWKIKTLLQGKFSLCITWMSQYITRPRFMYGKMWKAAPNKHCTLSMRKIALRQFGKIWSLAPHEWVTKTILTNLDGHCSSDPSCSSWPNIRRTCSVTAVLASPKNPHEITIEGTQVPT